MRCRSTNWPRIGSLGLTSFASAAVLSLVAVSSANGVIDGQLDGNAHPNVGMVVTVDETGGGIVCTGTLVAPSTFLTAAHCTSDDPEFPHALAYSVTFSEAQSPDDVLAMGIPGTPDPHPDFDWPFSAGDDGPLDVGLVHLSYPATNDYPGITPAPIIGSRVLDTIKNGSKPNVVQVGYGAQRFGPPGQSDSYFLDGTRRRSEFFIRKIFHKNPAYVVLAQSNPNDANGYGGSCAGDSGSPWFLDGVIAVVDSFATGGGPFGCNNGAGGPRLDTGPARAFLRSRGLVP